MSATLDPRLELIDVLAGEATVVLRGTRPSDPPFVHRVTVGGDRIVREDGSTYITPTITGWAEGILAGGENAYLGAVYPTRAAAANALLDGLIWAAGRDHA